jgi:hypothetical protein
MFSGRSRHVPGIPGQRERHQGTRGEAKDWCHGEPGVPHGSAIGREAMYGWHQDRPCGPPPAWVRRLFGIEWICLHREVCPGCGRIIRPSLPPQECPDRPTKPGRVERNRDG